MRLTMNAAAIAFLPLHTAWTSLSFEYMITDCVDHYRRCLRCRLIERDANGQRAFSAGAAINMHLAASLVVQLGADAPGGSAPNASSSSPSAPHGGGGRRYNGASTNAPSALSQASDHEPKQDSVDGPNAVSTSQVERQLIRMVDGAARASVVNTELTNLSVVDLVAGVVDADEMGAREVGLLEVVKTKLSKKVTETAPRVVVSDQGDEPPKQFATGRRN